MIEYIQTSTQLASSPKCTAQKKREYVKTVVWAAKQITKKYETKLGSGKSEQILSESNNLSISYLYTDHDYNLEIK